MAQEFKDFDKKYAYMLKEGVATPEELRMIEIKDCSYWPAIYGRNLTCSQDHIRRCVYEYEGAEEWQRFRVGLKAVNTRVKILRLERVCTGAIRIPGGDVLNRIRVVNYIGALRRGGQLDANFRVVK